LFTIQRVCNRCTGFVAMTTQRQTRNVSECFYSLYAWLTCSTNVVTALNIYMYAVLNRGRHLYSSGRPSRWALAHMLVGLGSKFLDNGSQPSLNGSPQNLHTSFVWGQALKPTCENYPPEKFAGWKTLKFRRLSSDSPSAGSV